MKIPQIITVIILFNACSTFNDNKANELNKSASEDRGNPDTIKYDRLAYMLLVSDVSKDTFNYIYYIRQYYDLFISSLISQIDDNESRSYFNPDFKNLYASTYHTKSAYIGERSICYLVMLIQDRILIDSSKNSFALCKYCVTSLQNKSNGSLSMSDLKNIKTIFLNWQRETTSLDYDSKKRIWVDKYFQKVNEIATLQ